MKKKKIGDLTVNEIDKICRTTPCITCPFNKKITVETEICFDIADLQRCKNQEIEIEVEEDE